MRIWLFSYGSGLSARVSDYECFSTTYCLSINVRNSGEIVLQSRTSTFIGNVDV